ncbi:conserved exported hypothetical protein [Verrucomicrobia bacterium]|nr:conserved exported hypothetical protein [Verrucomicrobiota bacterium]
MKYNAWTLALVGAGVISLPAVTHADESTNAVLSALAATTISGYVDTSAQWNLGTGDANVPSYAFGGPGKADGFNLNVVKLTIARDVVPTDSWGAGYKADLLFGPDADAFHTQSTGVTGDFAVKQAYVALHAPIGNGLDFKVGVWDTIIGYEVFESVNNPNVTRSYGYSIEPTTHTGVQATYQFCDAVSATVGVADTFGPTINGRAFLGGGTTVPATGQGPEAESYKTYMGSITFTAPTNMSFLSGSTLSACIINGFNAGSVNNGVGANQTSYYVGATINTPVTGLKFGACFDYAEVPEQAPTVAAVAGGTLADAYARARVFGVYGSYQLTEKLGFYGRWEYAESDALTPFLATKLYEFTGTLQYDLWKNVLTRLEFRWDHAADASGPYGGTVAGTPGGKDNSYILLADIAYKF